MNDLLLSPAGFRPARRVGVRRVAAALALLGTLVAGAAQACTSIERRPVNHNSHHDSYPDGTRREITTSPTFSYIEGCTTHDEDFDMWVTLNIPGLKPAGTVSWRGRGIVQAYETGPDSPLLAFVFGQSNPWYPPATPLELGVRTRIDRTATDIGFVGHNLTVGVFTRGAGERLRSIELSGGTYDIDVGAYPALGGSVPVAVKVTFPATTCPLQDVAETLQDVPLGELPSAGAHARAKDVVVRMLCGADAPRARLALHDAGDAGNAGSALTPTADSDAEGVRIELLRAGTPVRFGERWNFDPGIGGTHEHVFSARYLRSVEALKPGVIRGEAVLDVDYW